MAFGERGASKAPASQADEAGVTTYPVSRVRDGALSDGLPVGERVVRCLEAALEPSSRQGIAGLGATRRGRGRGAQTRTAPNPQQSLGLVGRSQPRPTER